MRKRNPYTAKDDDDSTRDEPEILDETGALALPAPRFATRCADDDVVSNAEQDSLAKALLAEALVAQKGYRAAALVLLTCAILCVRMFYALMACVADIAHSSPRRLPQAELPVLLALVLRLSLSLTIVRLGHGIWTTGTVPSPRAVDLVLLIAPALTGASAFLSLDPASSTTPSRLVRALPLFLQLASVWAAQQGESLVRDARGLENLKYSAPGA